VDAKNFFVAMLRNSVLQVCNTSQFTKSILASGALKFSYQMFVKSGTLYFKAITPLRSLNFTRTVAELE